MDIEDQDRVAVATAQVRSLLNIISAAGHVIDREELLEVVGVAAEKAELACQLVSRSQPGAKKPGDSPAGVVITPCGDGVLCHLRAAAASNA